MQTEGIDVRSVGNSLTLHETALVEAFNLKAAIEYQLKNFEGAQEALTDMPPRSEEELDCVTLHNQVLGGMDRISFCPDHGIFNVSLIIIDVSLLMCH